MIGSPNHVFFIYDGDDSDGVGAGAGPAGSAADREGVRALLHAARRAVQGHRLLAAARTTARSSPSASRPAACSPAPRASRPPRRRRSGAARRASSTTRATTWPATPTPTTTTRALDVNSDAVAYATLQYAMNTEDVNGQRGKGNFRPITPVALGRRVHRVAPRWPARPRARPRVGLTRKVSLSLVRPTISEREPSARSIG